MGAIMNFYGQSINNGGFSPDPVDKILYERYFKEKTDGFFIEAGANDGLFLTSCKTFEEIGWHGMNFEPSKKLFAKLVSNRPKSINLDIALSDKKSKVIFEDIDFDNGGFSRISHESRNKKFDEQFKLVPNDRYEITTEEYESVLKRHGISSVDLMVLDVEGHELEVIDGMGTDRSIKPKVFCIEHTHVGFDNLKKKLENDYVYDWHDGLNVIYIRK